jgi:hypothetical protein
MSTTGKHVIHTNIIEIVHLFFFSYSFSRTGYPYTLAHWSSDLYYYTSGRTPWIGDPINSKNLLWPDKAEKHRQIFFSTPGYKDSVGMRKSGLSLRSANARKNTWHYP